MSMAWTRITIGAGLIALTLGVLLGDLALARWYGCLAAPGFWGLLLAVLLTSCWEFLRMLRRRGHPCRPAIALAFTALLVGSTWVSLSRCCEAAERFEKAGGDMAVLLLVALMGSAFVAEMVRVERRHSDVAQAAGGVGWTVLVVLSVGLLGMFLAKIRFLSRDPLEGFLYVALTLGTVKAGDIGAYAIGSTLGRRALVPALSPKKTVEGLAGALAAGIAAAVAIGYGSGRFNAVPMLGFGLAVGAAGVLGDLGESMLKRACGTKDSGPIPGFGGVLDILDSVLAAAPVAYAVLVVLTGPGDLW